MTETAREPDEWATVEFRIVTGNDRPIHLGHLDYERALDEMANHHARRFRADGVGAAVTVMESRTITQTATEFVDGSEVHRTHMSVWSPVRRLRSVAEEIPKVSTEQVDNNVA